MRRSAPGAMTVRPLNTICVPNRRWFGVRSAPKNAFTRFSTSANAFCLRVAGASLEIMRARREFASTTAPYSGSSSKMPISASSRSHSHGCGIGHASFSDLPRGGANLNANRSLRSSMRIPAAARRRVSSDKAGLGAPAWPTSPTAMRAASVSASSLSVERVLNCSIRFSNAPTSRRA